MKKVDIRKVNKIALLGVTVIGLSLIATASVMLSSHRKEINERARTEAVNRGVEAMKENVISKFEDYSKITARIAGKIEGKSEEMEIKSYISGIISSEEVANKGLHEVKIFKNDGTKDNIYNANFIDITENSANDLALNYRANLELSSQESHYLGRNVNNVAEDGTFGTFRYYEFYAPVKNNSVCDGISLYYYPTGFQRTVGEDYKHSDARLSLLAHSDGTYFNGDRTGDPDTSTKTESLFNELSLMIGDKKPISSIEELLRTHKSGVVDCKIQGVNHVVSVQMSDICKDIALVEIYEMSVLAKSTVDFLNAIVAVILVFVFIILITIAYLVYNHVKLQKRLNHSDTTDQKLLCLNRLGFEQETKNILSRQGDVYYAVIVAELRHYKYLLESYGEEEVSRLVDYIRLSCHKTCKVEETYGHLEEGKFVLVLHEKNREALVDRLKIHAFLASQYHGLHKFDVAIRYGIYEYQREEKVTVSNMIDFAYEALSTATKSSVDNINLQFNFYSDELRKIRHINEDMELRQESALRDGEFVVFYQAKYNLDTKRQDGAEALIRWYDKNTNEYNAPALFMALFESNGFIEKIDKYVYTKVCEYISYSIANGHRVFPVSVNVSRITATQTGFIDYYVKMKKKFNIPNGAITIEFTESFAFENYDILRDIVDQLHTAGFKCSIDDFGCGYSSYRILKELPMDEIKLDKFFIDRSENPERVDNIFRSVISLAKSLNMKVTQEGVERKEDVELLKSHGCNVIQGYVYSKPLSLTDYLNFCNKSKDLKL